MNTKGTPTPPAVIPTSPDVFTVNCSFCNTPIRLPDDAGGKIINCPNCKAKNLIAKQPPKSMGEHSTSSSGPKTEPSDDDE
jgi:LSD1 subclass zinc finger protein